MVHTVTVDVSTALVAAPVAAHVALPATPTAPAIAPALAATAQALAAETKAMGIGRIREGEPDPPTELTEVKGNPSWCPSGRGSTLRWIGVLLGFAERPRLMLA